MCGIKVTSNASWDRFFLPISHFDLRYLSGGNVKFPVQSLLPFSEWHWGRELEAEDDKVCPGGRGDSKILQWHTFCMAPKDWQRLTPTSIVKGFHGLKSEILIRKSTPEWGVFFKLSMHIWSKFHGYEKPGTDLLNVMLNYLWGDLHRQGHMLHTRHNM